MLEFSRDHFVSQYAGGEGISGGTGVVIDQQVFPSGEQTSVVSTQARFLAR